MTRARDFADVISGQFDLPAGSLDNSEVVDDATPQLGGNLDLNSNNITGTGNLDISGDITINDSSPNVIIKVGGTEKGYLRSSSDVTEINGVSGAALRHNGFTKLATTTSGIDVTGTVTASGAIEAQGGNAPSGGFHLDDTGGTSRPRITSDSNNATVIRAGSATGDVVFNNFANSVELMRIEDAGKMQIRGNESYVASDVRFQVNASGGNGTTVGLAVACNGSNLGNQAARIYLGRSNNRIQSTVDGNANFRDDIQVQAGGSGGVSLSSGGTSWTGASDENVKTIIENITGALDDIATLRTVIGRYDWDADDKRRSFLIAQDVQAVLPEAVETNPEGTLMLDYTGVIPLLTAALKEAKTKIEALETENTTQATQIADLITRVTALEAAE